MLRDILACGVASCLGVAGLWALGAPLDWLSASAIALGLWIFSAYTVITTS